MELIAEPVLWTFLTLKDGRTLTKIKRKIPRVVAPRECAMQVGQLVTHPEELDHPRRNQMGQLQSPATAT